MRTESWAARPLEQARLLNPAFIGVLLWACANRYESTTQVHQPYALSFLVAPLILHKRTRELLPITTRTSLAAWLTDTPDIHVGFSERARARAPVVKEAILFAAARRTIQVQGTRIVPSTRPRAMSRFEREASGEVNACIKKSEFVGKWFALSGEYTTIMALFGVTP